MAKPVFMPRVGQSVESSIIATWYKNVGDPVAVGDKLFAFETDKATFEEEAKDSGILLVRFFEEGDDVPCKMNVCVIGQKGESFEEFAPDTQSAEEKIEDETQDVEKKEKSETESTVVETASAILQTEGFVKISPRAKALATRYNVEYRLATPTGSEGRIVEKDIQALIDSKMRYTSAAFNMSQGMDKVAAVSGSGLGGRVTVQDIANGSKLAGADDSAMSGDAYEDVKLTNIRKVIAQNMQQSLSTMAQLTHSTSFDATGILAFRKQIKEKAEIVGLEDITLNDIVIFAVARTLQSHGDLNAHYLDDKLRKFKNVHIGMAVDTERGLMVPTVFNANLLSLNEIAKQTKLLAKEAKEGNISPDKLAGASFTISNLGLFGIEHFTPVINPPQTGILGVNNIQTRIKMVNGEMKPYQAMGLSLTYDHRAIDGAPASRFLQDLCRALENFGVLLAG